MKSGRTKQQINNTQQQVGILYKCNTVAEEIYDVNLAACIGIGPLFFVDNSKYT
jgi:hypothetical protein